MENKKEQDQIIFENIHYKHMGGWWKNYPPKSLGNIIHWLFTYGTLHIAENVLVGENGIYLNGNLLLRFKFNDERPEIPFFYDLQTDKYSFIMQNQDVYIKGLEIYYNIVKTINDKYEKYKI